MTYQLHNQDCLEWMKQQPAESIDPDYFKFIHQRM
jgi:hypothetical protein